MYDWITLSTPANPTAGTPAAEFASTWGRLRTLGGEELDKAQQIAQRSTYMITIPFQSGVVDSMTASVTEPDGNVRTFQVEHIEAPDNRHFQLLLYVFEMGQNVGE